jgi:uncharacterized protein YndB with AHSA1/START domain
MALQNAAKNDFTGRELVITRLLNAPAELVWEVWTNPDHIKNWWGPNGFTNTIFTMDVKPGGVWDLIMHGPDGTDYKNKSIYAEVVPFKKIVYDHVSGPAFQATVTFEEQDKKTLLTWRMQFETAEELNKVVKQFKADEGLKQNVIKLAAYLQSAAVSKELTLTRVINAPIALVFKAWTDAKQLAKWWGPDEFTNPVCNVDLQPGGSIYIEMKAADGTVYPMNGVFKEIEAPKRLVFVCGPVEKNGSHPFEVLNSITFIEQNGKTLVTVNAKVSKVTAAAAPYLAGMDEGWSQSLDRLIHLTANQEIPTPK